MCEPEKRVTIKFISSYCSCEDMCEVFVLRTEMSVTTLRSCVKCSRVISVSNYTVMLVIYNAGPVCIVSLPPPMKAETTSQTGFQ